VRATVRGPLPYVPPFASLPDAQSRGGDAEARGSLEETGAARCGLTAALVPESEGGPTLSGSRLTVVRIDQHPRGAHEPVYNEGNNHVDRKTF